MTRTFLHKESTCLSANACVKPCLIVRNKKKIRIIVICRALFFFEITQSDIVHIINYRWKISPDLFIPRN